LITADTNIFVYAADPGDRLKQEIAWKVIARLKELGAPIALQLIGEYQNVLRRKFKTDAWRSAESARYLLNSFICFPSSRDAVSLALAQMAAGQLSYWDALMLASAREAGCDVFISEDLQDGARLFGLEIVNPFAATGPSDRVKHLLDLA
jgi:predicted nucleic acid-binding protein